MQIYGTLALLVVDAIFSWARMFAALGISIALSIAIGVYAAVSRRAERVILPVLDVFQTIPILAFFPLALVVFVFYLPGYIGINAAVIFLIVTSMLWNIIFGVYEAVKTIPNEFLEVADLYRMGIWEKMRKIFIPAAAPRIVQQSILSWSIGLFYLVTSEIFSYGSTTCCSVKYGIGAALVQLSPGAPGGSVTAYLLGIAVFIVFVVLTRFLFFRPLERYTSRYTRTTARSPTLLARPGMFVSWFSRRVVAQPITRLTLRARQATGAQRKPADEAVARAKVKARKPVGRWVYYAAAAAVLLIVFASSAAIRDAIFTYEYAVLTALAFSFARIWLAFLVITAVAIPLCVYLIFISRQSSKYLLFFQVVASIPATILLPGIAIAIGSAPYHAEIVAFIIFVLSGIWYVIFSIIASTRTIPPYVSEVKSLFRVNGKAAWKSIYIKAMIPGFVTGALTAIAAEWNASIVAECFTTNGIAGGSVINCVGTGIGKLLDSTVTSGNITLMLVALLNLVVMILLINTFVWKRMYKNVSKIYT